MHQILNTCAYGPIIHAVGAQRTLGLGKAILADLRSKGPENVFTAAPANLPTTLREAALYFAIRTALAEGSLSSKKRQMLLVTGQQLVAPPFDSGTVSMGTHFGDTSGAPGSQHGLINFLSTPGPLGIDTESLIQKSRFAFPEARQAIAAHHSVFSVSVSSLDSTIPARFDAARRMTCLTAVFAKLPTCLGIYFPSADLLLPPKTWVAAADMAHKGKFPALQWINYAVAALTESTFTVNSIGCAAFNGHEVCMPAVRLDPKEAVQHVYATTVMMLEYGHEYRDDDTMGNEEGTLKLRLRHCAEGVHGFQTDTWTLFHPNSVLDEHETFGDRPRSPPPPGVDNRLRGDEGWLKKGLRLFGAARSGKPN